MFQEVNIYFAETGYERKKKREKVRKRKNTPIDNEESVLKKKVIMNQIKSKLGGFLFSMSCYFDFSLHLEPKTFDYFETIKRLVISILMMAVGLLLLLLYDLFT